MQKKVLGRGLKALIPTGEEKYEEKAKEEKKAAPVKQEPLSNKAEEPAKQAAKPAPQTPVKTAAVNRRVTRVEPVRQSSKSAIVHGKSQSKADKASEPQKDETDPSLRPDLFFNAKTGRYESRREISRKSYETREMPVVIGRRAPATVMPAPMKKPYVPAAKGSIKTISVPQKKNTPAPSKPAAAPVAPLAPPVEKPREVVEKPPVVEASARVPVRNAQIDMNAVKMLLKKEIEKEAKHLVRMVQGEIMRQGILDGKAGKAEVTAIERKVGELSDTLEAERGSLKDEIDRLRRNSEEILQKAASAKGDDVEKLRKEFRAGIAKLSADLETKFTGAVEKSEEEALRNSEKTGERIDRVEAALKESLDKSREERKAETEEIVKTLLADIIDTIEKDHTVIQTLKERDAEILGLREDVGAVSRAGKENRNKIHALKNDVKKESGKAVTAAKDALAEFKKELEVEIEAFKKETRKEVKAIREGVEKTLREEIDRVHLKVNDDVEGLRTDLSKVDPKKIRLDLDVELEAIRSEVKGKLDKRVSDLMKRIDSLDIGVEQKIEEHEAESRKKIEESITKFETELEKVKKALTLGNFIEKRNVQNPLAIKEDIMKKLSPEITALRKAVAELGGKVEGSTKKQ